MAYLSLGTLSRGAIFLPRPFPACLPSPAWPAALRCQSRISVTSYLNSDPSPRRHRWGDLVVRTFKTASSAVILTVAAAFVVRVGSFSARAETAKAGLSEFGELHSESGEALRSLFERKLEEGDAVEALKVVRKLVSAQPAETLWKYHLARLLNDLGMGEAGEAREMFDAILTERPIFYDALFPTALWMHRCGEGEAVMERLKEALELTRREGRENEARDVKCVLSQVQFWQNKSEEALRGFEELVMEDPTDFRPYFGKAVIYSLLDKGKEAREQFARFKEVSRGKFDAEEVLQTLQAPYSSFVTVEEN